MTEQKPKKQNQTNYMKFSSCVIRKTGHYYKTTLLWGGILVVVVAILYGIIIVGSTILLPMLTQILSGLSAVPIWAYIPVGIIVIPILVAIVVCYIKRNDDEIRKADEEYICPE